MNIADAHVDVLWKLLQSQRNLDVDTPPDLDLFYQPHSPLQASYAKLASGGVRTQVFALFVDPLQPPTTQLEDVLCSMDVFYHQVVREGKVRAVRNGRELEQARRNDEIAGLLSIEGGACLRGRPELLRTMYELGVRGMGLTWNFANEMADGCGEQRGAGLTQAGQEIVREMSQLGMWVDLAHLADAGVEDVFRESTGPVMASHANARIVHNHRRNLRDETIQELIHRRGWMGFVFEGSFVGPLDDLRRDKVFDHIDHVLALGGEDLIGLGSDFDGTSNPVAGLADASDYADFSITVQQRYGDTLAQKLLFDNFEQFLHRALPG